MVESKVEACRKLFFNSFQIFKFWGELRRSVLLSIRCVCDRVPSWCRSRYRWGENGAVTSLFGKFVFLFTVKYPGAPASHNVMTLLTVDLLYFTEESSEVGKVTFNKLFGLNVAVGKYYKWLIL